MRAQDSQAAFTRDQKQGDIEAQQLEEAEPGRRTPNEPGRQPDADKTGYE
jgi:hypothetical protein